MGEHEMAIANYTRAVELIPDYYEAYFNRAVAHASLGRTAEAIADYRSAIDHTDDEAVIDLAQRRIDALREE
jgi:tetratricopeptide (TPR) repeat protein